MKYICLLALLGTTACAPTPDDTSGVLDISDAPFDATTQEAVLNEECDAADYRALIGTSVTETVFSIGDRLRVYAESDIVTQEYIPQRTNVVYDAGGKIVRVTCG